MINVKTVLAIIPARGGSKGLPGKNIKALCGKPLIAWSIEQAKKSEYIDRLILSSEYEEIIKVAKECSCEVPFIRPVELAKDGTPGIEPVLHALNTLKEQYDYVVLLQPTSPLRTIDDIDGCIERCVEANAPSCISVSETDHSPYWMVSVDEKDALSALLPHYSNVHRRQDLPKVYFLNGAVYIAESNWLMRHKSFRVDNQTIAFFMEKKRSLDIDTEIDFQLCEFLISKSEAQ